MFQVVIFDRSALEIEFPMISKENHEKSKPGEEHLLSKKMEEIEDTSIEILDDDFQSCR